MEYPLIVETLKRVERLRSLLLDPHPGLITWVQAVYDANRELNELFTPKGDDIATQTETS